MSDPAAMSPESYRFPLSTRIWMAVGVLLVPLLHLLLIVLALACLAGAGLAVYGGWALAARGAVRGVLVVRGLLLLSIPVVAALLAAYALLRAAALSFWRRSFFRPAVWVNPMREPDLYSVVAGVCTDLKTPLPDSIILCAGPEFFVMQHEHTVLNANPRGRILGLSLPLMSCLSVNELRAILYHEFAHFTGGDVRYSRIVSPAYVGIGEAIVALEAAKRPGYHLGAGVFRFILSVPQYILHFYAYIFVRIDLHTTRAREFRADAIQACCAGTASAANALRKVSAYGSVFYDVIPSLLEEIRQSRDRDESPYRLFRKRTRSWEEQARKYLALYLAETEDRWQSHPTLTRRLEALPRCPERFDDKRPALVLLRELKAYEKMLGQFVTHEYQLFRKDMGIR